MELKVDILIVPVLPAILAAKQATKTIPIVMVTNRDPVATGIVDSLARPGGNITGLTTLSRDLSGKRLELLKETVPKLSRVGVLRDLENQSTAIAFTEYASRGARSKSTVQSLEVRPPKPDLEVAIQAAVKGHANALITITTSSFFVTRSKLPI